MKTRRHPFLAGALALLLGVAALAGCGDDDDGEAAASPETTADAGGEAIAGCEGAAPQLEIDPDKEPARCEPGAPAPVPLAERSTVKVAIASTSAEYAGPLMLAQTQGEFEKENLDVQVQVMPSSDSVQLVGTGEIDVNIGSSAANIFNAISQGFEMKWVIGFGWNSPDSGQGVWARGADVDISDLVGKTIGSAIGAGSPINLALQQQLPEGVSITDFNFQTISPVDTVTALQNGAVEAAVILDPFWLPLQDDPDYTFIAEGAPPGNNIAGVFYGPSLLERPDVAAAFARAYIRTMNTYLDGDYKADPESLASLSEALGVPEENLASIPSFIYDFDIPHEATDQLQELFFEADAASYDEPLPEDEVVDRTFVGEAVGIPRQ